MNYIDSVIFNLIFNLVIILKEIKVHKVIFQLIINEVVFYLKNFIIGYLLQKNLI